MLKLSAATAVATTSLFATATALTPAADWAALRDAHIGVALQQELHKAHHWRRNVAAVQNDDDDTKNNKNSNRSGNPFDLNPNTGELRLGIRENISNDNKRDQIYTMQLLGIEYDDTFAWAWAAADAAAKGQSVFLDNDFMPHLPADPNLICTAFRQCEELEEYPEFSTMSAIPCTITHNTEVFCEIATSVLWQKAQPKDKERRRASATNKTGGWVYQVPDYATGAIYTWLMEMQDENDKGLNAINNNKDDSGNIDSDDDSFVSLSPTARLAAMVEKLVHPHYAHRVSSPTRAFRNYAQALDMRTIVTSDPDEPVTQLTATPRNIFWGDSVLIFCDPTHDLITGISGQWGGALHTTFIEYDNVSLKFVELDRQPSLNLTNGEMIMIDNKVVTANCDASGM